MTPIETLRQLAVDALAATDDNDEIRSSDLITAIETLDTLTGAGHIRWGSGTIPAERISLPELDRDKFIRWLDEHPNGGIQIAGLDTFAASIDAFDLIEDTQLWVTEVVLIPDVGELRDGSSEA